MAELRNRRYGTGHGQASAPNGLGARHAPLTPQRALTRCELMLDTLRDPEAPWRKAPAGRQRRTRLRHRSGLALEEERKDGAGLSGAGMGTAGQWVASSWSWWAMSPVGRVNGPQTSSTSPGRPSRTSRRTGSGLGRAVGEGASRGSGRYPGSRHRPPRHNPSRLREDPQQS
ncbi:abortive infection family protein [Kitasatospora purpeofusca]|uniref:abortive infection family protein n=1 Tax=Kitasatospora purpeofusca TaxID=67352 RepID=UPI0038994657|nr:abortive infection family protein [Kitasatospora purpeofusca]